jgi:hypothetical protein
MFPKDHKIQTDKRERPSSGGACHGSARCHRKGNFASGGASSIRRSRLGGTSKVGKPTKAAITGESTSGKSPQTQGSTVAGSLQQQESEAAHEDAGSGRKSANPSTKVARKQARNVKTLFISAHS